MNQFFGRDLVQMHAQIQKEQDRINFTPDPVRQAVFSDRRLNSELKNIELESSLAKIMSEYEQQCD